jgi:hypothetical protein
LRQESVLYAVRESRVALEGFVGPRNKKLKSIMPKNTFPSSSVNHTRPTPSHSLLSALVATTALTVLSVHAQCPVVELSSDLRIPLGIAQSNQGNLLVSETGTRTPNTGRISIIRLDGHRRTLLDGLPSGINGLSLAGDL